MAVEILQGDALTTLRTLPDESVHCCITSPPYYGLRSYLPDGHNDKPMEIGLEESPEAFIERLVEVFREVERVLHPSGVIFVNMGDGYWGGKGKNGNTAARQTAEERGYKQSSGTLQVPWRPQDGKHPIYKPKDLLGMPWRLAFALQADGWWLRSEITWCKKSAMPESVRDRPTTATEKIFLLAKQAKYFYDAEAVKVPAVTKHLPGHNMTDTRKTYGPQNGGNSGIPKMLQRYHEEGLPTHANQRNFWLLGPENFPDAHFAVFPTEVPRRCILAGTSARGVCPACLAPYERIVEKTGGTIGQSWHNHSQDKEAGMSQYDPKLQAGGLGTAKGKEGNPYRVTTTGWRPTCACDAGDPVPATVLDPFGGAGTTGLVANRLGRNAILIELKEEYCAMARKRIHDDAPLFAERESYVST